MKAAELVPKQGNVDIDLEITEVGPVREFSKFGKAGRVATAIGKDDSGDIKISLWNEQIDQVKTGDTVSIKNGYVSEWQGEKQLSTGRMGTLEVASSAPSAEKLVEEATEEASKDQPVESKADDAKISEEEVE